MSIKVAIVEDSRTIRESLRRIIDDTPGLRCECAVGSAEEALAEMPRCRPDVILMDIHLPNISGIECTARLKETLPETDVIMLTVYEDNDKIFRALQAGACGYLLKSLKADEFIEMLRGVERGEAAMTRQTTARLMAGFGHRAEHSPQNLTPRETELLQLMAQGLSNKEIATALSLSENTVKYHLKNVLQKLGAHNRTEATAHAIRNGILKPDISE